MRKLLVTVFSVMLVAACAKSSTESNGPSTATTNDTTTTDTTTTTTTTTSATNCVPEHAGAVWTFEYCGPVDTTRGAPFSIPHDNMPAPQKGKLTFKITNLDKSELPDHDGTFFVFSHLYGYGDEREVNFSVVLWDSGGDNIVTYLITQRHDGVCSNFCERQSRQMGVQYERSHTYQFDFEWDTSNITLSITDTTTDTVLFVGTIPTDGPYLGVRYINVGNSALPHYGGVASAVQVFDLRLSIIQ